MTHCHAKNITLSSSLLCLLYFSSSFYFSYDIVIFINFYVQYLKKNLRRFDNDVNRSITWFLENSVEEDLPSQPAQRPTSLPPANTSFQPTNPPKPTYSQKPSPPVAPTYQLLPATNPSLAKAPALPIRPPIPSPPAETQSVPQSTKSVNLTATTSSTSTGAESDALIGILRSAMVSTTDRCRCVMFTVDRGDICGMPAALVGDADGTATDVAGDLCWSCKYMEAISGIDATLATSEDEDEAEERQDQAVASNADAAADAAEIAKAEASREVEIPVPAPAPAEEPKGWFSGWLSGGKSVKESDISNGALTKNDREALEGEFVALKGLKQHGVMSDTQKARFRLVRRSLRTNEALVTPLGVEAVTSSPRRGSSQAIVSGSSGSRSSGGSKVETESAKVARLKKLLRDAKVSDVPIICSCSMYSVVPGEVCGRPVALAVDPETNIATPTKMCWQCKRIEVNTIVHCI